MKSQALFPRNKSVDLWQKAEKIIPCGSQTLSKAPNQYAEGVYPIYIEKGLGSHVWDVDGNEFIDFPLGLGAAVLGYNYPAVSQAIEKQLHNGIVYSLMHPLELELAELITSLIPCAEMVRFTKTGSEATSAAIRIARAYTNRSKIAACGYHGWHDWYVGCTPRNKGVPEDVKNLLLTFQYNKIETLEELFKNNPDQIAAVIMEPVSLVEPQNDFLKKVAELTRSHGALLIFDEIITGFRFSLGGAQTLYGVTPDLCTMGKAIANGMPLNLVAGKKEYMNECEKIFFSSTFGGETLSLAAGLATIQEMQKHKVIDHLWKQGKKFLTFFNEAIRKNDLNAELVGFGPRQFLNFYDEAKKPSTLLKSIFWQECIKAGILFGNAQFISYSHSDEDIEKACNAADHAFDYVAQAVKSQKPEEWYQGKLPAEIFRKV